jgi:hypothetical protein
MSLFDNIFGSGPSNNKQQNIGAQQQNVLRGLPPSVSNNQIGANSIFQSQSLYQSMYGGYKGESVLNITTKLNNIESEKKYIEEQKLRYEKIKKEEELINNLHPITISILKLAEELSKSNNLEDLIKMDELVRNQLFNNELEKIINE